MRTCKERGPFRSSFASIFANIFTILFISIFASLLASLIANNKTCLTASYVASVISLLCLVFHCQEMYYFLQQDQGSSKFQPDNMMIQLKSLLI